MTSKTKGVGMIRDAHPTAPGGMSEKALVAELVEKHDWKKKDATAIDWPDKIQAVVQERRARELEAYAAAVDELPDEETLVTLPEALTSELADLTAEETPEPEASGDEDFDDLLADMFTEVEEITEEADSNYPTLLLLDDSTFDYRFNNHAGAGPSSSERWLNCTQSLRMSREFLQTLTPNQQRDFAGAGVAARQGTIAHSAAEAKLLHAFGDMDDAELETTILDLTVTPDADEAYTEEMGDYVDEYVDYVKMLADEGREILVERSVEATVDLTGGHEGEVYGVRGSADAIALPTPEHTSLVVVDLKYGNGLYVDPDSNPQVRIYGLAALELLMDEEGYLPDELEEMVYVIAQPRLGGIKEWRESVDNLLEWRDTFFAPRLTAALFGEEEGAEFAPSEETCNWCPARGACSALVEQRATQAGGLFDAISQAEVEGVAFPETDLLSDERLGELLTQAQSLTKIEKDLKAEAQRRLHRGGAVPGFKLVSYSPRRGWHDNAERVMAKVPEAWEPPRLRSPAQVEALIKEKVIVVKNEDKFKALISSPEKRPLVAPVNDRRKEWGGDLPEVGDLFTNMDKDGEQE